MGFYTHMYVTIFGVEGVLWRGVPFSSKGNYTVLISQDLGALLIELSFAFDGLKDFLLNG